MEESATSGMSFKKWSSEELMQVEIREQALNELRALLKGAEDCLESAGGRTKVCIQSFYEAVEDYYNVIIQGYSKRIELAGDKFIAAGEVLQDAARDCCVLTAELFLAGKQDSEIPKIDFTKSPSTEQQVALKQALSEGAELHYMASNHRGCQYRLVSTKGGPKAELSIAWPHILYEPLTAGGESCITYGPEVDALKGEIGMGWWQLLGKLGALCDVH